MTTLTANMNITAAVIDQADTQRADVRSGSRFHLRRRNAQTHSRPSATQRLNPRCNLCSSLLKVQPARSEGPPVVFSAVAADVAGEGDKSNSSATEGFPQHRSISSFAAPRSPPFAEVTSAVSPREVFIRHRLSQQSPEFRRRVFIRLPLVLRCHRNTPLLS
ncbi:MAG UNVERIFIED_CONTAM: hypothetical protein LVR18_37530 [Planctomycetaceae bacterium]